MNPYLFLVGCLRSGTTLLQRIVGAHPQIAVIHETQWVPQWWERQVGLIDDGTVTPELVHRLVAHRRFGRLEVDADRVAGLLRGGEKKHYARFVSEVFDLHGEVKGKSFVGEKSPGYVRHLRTLNVLWPDAKIVHLIRDGRDVALSVLDWKKQEATVGRFATWQDDPVITIALWWEWHVRLGREAGPALGPQRYHEVRYESLVADPELECAGLATFLEVPYDAAMLRFHEGRTRSKPGIGTKAAWLPVTAGVRSWREQMRPEDVERFEAAAGPLLEELGYERAVRGPGAATRERAERLRSRFAEEVRTRKRAVPHAWERAAA